MAERSARVTAATGMALALGLSTVGAGCALTQKSAPVEFRYFTPEAVAAPAAGAGGGGRRGNRGGAGADHAPGALEVRLGRINAASYVRDRIAYRDEGHELGYYEELRWSEKPEAYLRRGVARVLFEEHGVRELVSKPGATLEVELDAFEELRAPRHVARVVVTWSLRDDQSVRLQRTFAAEKPIAERGGGGLPEAIAAAMSEALGEAVTTIADATIAELSNGPGNGPADGQPSHRNEGVPHANR